jgi:catechol 2,3-dioxygenase-like lactoylglutathione lyase family enzyme
MIPVKDLGAARRFYEETLGLRLVNVEPGVVATYASGGATMNVYQSQFGGTNKGTAALWEVDDIDGTVKQLKARGVSFEHYDDMQGVTREGDIHRAGPIKVAWLKDPSGNILSLQSRPAA